MIEITSIHVHYREKDTGKKEPKRGVIKIKPSDPENKLAIQHDIAEVVKKLRDRAKYEYYYVVVEIDRGGRPAYRTVVPKTLF